MASGSLQGDPALASIASEHGIELTPNQVASWNLRRLRSRAGMTQERLAELMTHFGIPWTMFTVSDAELALGRVERGRRFTTDEMALLALLFYVTPTALLVPPSRDDIGDGEGEVTVRIGDLVMPRESYLTDVLLRPSGVAARDLTGEITEKLGSS